MTVEQGENDMTLIDSGYKLSILWGIST